MPAVLRQRIWDLPTRVFHWATVGLFGFSWWSADSGHMDWHRLSGYMLIALLLARLYWGFAGSSTARFAGFLRGPAAFAAYARTLTQQPGPISVGHNPMGGWSVIALLLLLFVQVLSGLFAVDTDGLESGPLASLVSFGTGRDFAGVHGLNFNLLLTLVALHVGVVLFYLLYKRQNLIAPMLTGDKTLPSTSPAPVLASTIKAAIAFAVGLAIAAMIANGFG